MRTDETLNINLKMILAIITILSTFIGLIFWTTMVKADVLQNSKDISHQEAEIELLKTQLNDMKIQLSVITEQNKQLKITLSEVKSDISIIKEDIKRGN